MASAAVDSTGLECTTASGYFVRRRKTKDSPWKTVAYHHFAKLAVVLKPDDASIHWNLALVLDHRSDLDGAIDAYRGALALRPAHSGSARRLARALVQRDRAAEAVDVLEKAWRATDAKDPGRESIAELLGLYRRVMKAGEALGATTAAGIDALDADERFALAEAAGDLSSASALEEGSARAIEAPSSQNAGSRVS